MFSTHFPSSPVNELNSLICQEYNQNKTPPQLKTQILESPLYQQAEWAPWEPLRAKREWDSGWRWAGRDGQKCDCGSSKLLDELSHLADLRPALPLIPEMETSYTDVYNKHVCLAIYLKLETFHCCENMMTSDSRNHSWTSRYSLSCPVGGQKNILMQFALCKLFPILMWK